MESVAKPVLSVDRAPVTGVAIVRGLSVVISGFENLDFGVVCSVHEPMFVVDPPGPVPGQFPFERLWFPDPCEWVALDFPDESGDPPGRLTVGG